MIYTALLFSYEVGGCVDGFTVVGEALDGDAELFCLGDLDKQHVVATSTYSGVPVECFVGWPEWLVLLVACGKNLLDIRTQFALGACIGILCGNGDDAAASVGSPYH